MEVVGESVPGRGNNLGKGPEVVFPGTTRRPTWLSGKSKGEMSETGDVGGGPIMQSLEVLIRFQYLY